MREARQSFGRSLTFSKVGMVTAEPPAEPSTGSAAKVCPHFHAAVELVGKRWTGAILSALADGPCRFRELGEAVPGMSDRLLSQRLRELEAEGLVERSVEGGSVACWAMRVA